MTTPPPTGPDSTPIPPPSPTTDQSTAASSQSAQAAASDAAVARRDLGAVLAPETEVWLKAIKGKVTATALTSIPPTCSVNIQGDTSVVIDGVQMADTYTPVVGDTVVMGKQGSDVWVLFQMNDSGTGAQNGWTAPTLGTGITTNGGYGPLEYRRTVDGGDMKITFRGSIAIAAGQTAVCTLPAGFRPSYSRSLALARQQNQNQVTIRCDFNTDGTVVLFGETAAATVATTNTVVNVTTTVGSPTGGNSNGHFHTLNTASLTGRTSGIAPYDHDHNFASTSNPAFTNNQNTGHTHNTPDHDHPTVTHNHGVTVTQDPPAWVSFNGVEYYL